jgi:Fe2+ or Zn2+ uptake regulation protein
MIHRYADFLASKGRTLTPGAARVVDVVFSKTGTFGSEDVVASMHGEVSRATIHRTLSGLTEAELLRRVKFNGQTVYVVAAPAEDSERD